MLTSSANSIGKGYTANQQGKGRLNLSAALSASPGAATQQKPVATGLGSIETSRGGMNIQTDCGNDGTIDVIAGEIDARCEKWDPKAWTGAAWTGSAWTGAAWTTCPDQNTGTTTTKTKTGDQQQGQFLTTRWGTRPKHNQKVNGEQSDP